VGALFGSLSALSIGLSDLFARRVVRASTPLTAAVAVSVMAIATGTIAVVVLGSSMRSTDFLIGIVSGLGLGTGLSSYYAGITRSSSTVVTPVVAALSAIIPFLYALIDGAPPTVWAVLGAVVAVAGLLLITMGGGGAHHLRAGLAWGLLSGVAYGSGFAVVIETSSGAGALPAVGQRIAASLLVIGLAIRQRDALLPPSGARVVAMIGGLVAGMSTVLYLIGVRADATAAVITSSMFPAFSVAIGRTFFGDSVSRTQALGIAVVLVGVVAVSAG
jgi:drug/metabolite transporter (DMT)-like permease